MILQDVRVWLLRTGSRANGQPFLGKKRGVSRGLSNPPILVMWLTEVSGSLHLIFKSTAGHSPDATEEGTRLSTPACTLTSCVLPQDLWEPIILLPALPLSCPFQREGLHFVTMTLFHLYRAEPVRSSCCPSV